MGSLSGVFSHHEAIGVVEGLETEFGVEAVGVSGGEDPAAQRLEIGVGEDGLDEPFAQLVTPVVGKYENVGEPGEGGVVGDEAAEADLFVVVVVVVMQVEAEG